MYKSIRIATSRSAIHVLPVFAGSDGALPPEVASISADVAGAVKAAAKSAGFKADMGEVIPAGDDAVLLGLGKRDELDAKSLRKAGSKLGKQLGRMAVSAAQIHLDAALSKDAMAPEFAARCIAEGLVLGNWRVDFFDGKATQHSKAQGTLSLSSSDAATTKGLKHGLTLAESTNYARQLAATPPNICNPTWITNEARKLARKTGMTCRVISFEQARKLGMGGLVNVGKASTSKPALIILEHKPEKPRKGVKLALVGKTITYDTGGYSLKPSASMKGMKSDKNGGMAVLGAMHAVATRNLPVHVFGILPTAENMVSADAYRPDDIITMYNGITVEVTNTDAEGRLVLADALAYTCEKIKPTAIIDAATLTGGVVVGLGHFCAGLWCNHDDLRSRILDAADSSGDRCWHMPLWKEHRDFMRAKHADLWNSAPSRNAHPIQGAAFLDFFVDEKVPWAHLDIAGMSDVESDDDMYVTGPTGFGVRLLADFVESHA